MKKMMMIAAALMVAAFAQAGSMDWQIMGRNNVKGVDGTTVLSGATVYLVLASDTTDIAKALTAGTDFSSYILGSDTLTANGNTSKMMLSTSAKIDAGKAYDFAVLVFNDYTMTAGKSGNYKFSLTKNEAANVDGDETLKISFAAADFSGSTWNGYTVVPEPTCMALLALGAVAFGLRRKICK